MIGEQLGEWVIDAEAGRGTLATVYRVHHAQDPARRMALKFLTDPRAADPSFQLRFQAEMAVLRRLDHPHIVRYYDHGIHAARPYLVTDWVEGESLEERLRQRQRLDWQEVLALSIQVVSALRYAHRRGILHRALKPSNVLRLADGRVALSDFGLLKLFNEPSGGQAVALPALPASFTTPEQLSGRALTKRSDFYALGNLLYTLLVGRPPFAGGNFVEVVHKVCFTLPERAIHYVADLPEELDQLISRLLAKEPAQRPGSGTLLLGELERIWSDLERKQRIGRKPEVPPSGSDADLLLDRDAVEGDEPDPPAPPREPVPWVRALTLGGGFLAVVGVLVWAFFFRGDSAEVLFERARPLLESDRPEDWERAWDESLSRLASRYPERHTAEVREAKQRVDAVRELRLAVTTGRTRQYQRESERFYYEGYRLCQAGDFEGARGRWQSLVRLFAGSEGDARWVRAAELGLQATRDLKGDSASALASQQRLRETLGQLADRHDWLLANAPAQATEFRNAILSLYGREPILEEFKARLQPQE